MPSNVASLSPGQNAYSDKCTFLRVEERAMLFPPAVEHLIFDLTRPLYLFGSVASGSQISPARLMLFFVSSAVLVRKDLLDLRHPKRFDVDSSVCYYIRFNAFLCA